MTEMLVSNLRSWRDMFFKLPYYNTAIMASAYASYMRYGSLVLEQYFPVTANDDCKFEYQVDGATQHFEVHLPKNFDNTRKYPCIVALHGCMQDADKLVSSTRINEYADANGYVVLYPEQDLSENALSCWNWSDPESQKRGTGEPYRIIKGIDKAIDKYNIDKDNINITGISAGGALSMALVCLYPEYFNAVVIHAGLKFNAADTAIESLIAMGTGIVDNDDDFCISKVKNTISGLIFHGTEDKTVNIKNANEIISQLSKLNKLISKYPQGNAQTEITAVKPENNKYGYTKIVLSQVDGSSILFYKVDGMGHAWSGGKEDLYSDPRGPNATDIMFKFFEEEYQRKHISHASDLHI